jgi:hypothetical protein
MVSSQTTPQLALLPSTSQKIGSWNGQEKLMFSDESILLKPLVSTAVVEDQGRA